MNESPVETEIVDGYHVDYYHNINNKGFVFKVDGMNYIGAYGKTLDKAKIKARKIIEIRKTIETPKQTTDQSSVADAYFKANKRNNNPFSR